MAKAEEIVVLNHRTRREVEVFATPKEASEATGWTRSVIYHSLKAKLDQKPRIYPPTGEQVILIKRYALETPEPEFEYVLTDGQLVYFKGTLKEATWEKRMLPFPNIVIDKWQKK